VTSFRLGRLAKQDLADIHNDIEPNNAAAAERLEDLFFDKFLLLSKQPGIGASRPEFAGGDLRVFPVENYAIFYRPFDGGIEIARVIHAARDFPALRFEGS
jgi:toxin ParE1/3/4